MGADTDRWLDIARDLLEQPTAPLIEDLPRARVWRAARAAGLAVDDDPAGNVLVRYDGPDADTTRPLVVVAHLDHPGFHVEAVDGDQLRLSFHGGLAADNVRPGSPLDLFQRGAPEACGRAEVVAAEADERGRLTAATATRTDGTAPADGFAMWGFPAWSVDDGRIVARVCDDLLGAAAALCLLVELAEAKPRDVAVWGLFTRAEEIGFLGALEAIRQRVVPTGADVLSLECSSALAGARQGDGVIVRVGDRMSVFDPGLTAALGAAATRLAEAEPGFRWQRKLMDGGACEATAFCAAGYRASGLALPLGGYHNADIGDDGAPVVGPEHVMVDDYLAEVRLLLELGLHPELLRPESGPPAWLVERTKVAEATLAGGR